MKGATIVAEKKHIDSMDNRALLARLRELHMTEPGDDEAAEACENGIRKSAAKH